MAIALWYIGKHKQDFIKEGVDYYYSKIKHYTNFEIKAFEKIKIGKNDSAELHKKIEADYILDKLPPKAYLILLDEKGKSYDSIKFARFMESLMVQSYKDIIFLIGGPYGFHESIYARSNAKVTLSEMTFSHQIIRLSFLEQLYRAFTINRGEKYHNS